MGSRWTQSRATFLFVSRGTSTGPLISTPLLISWSIFRRWGVGVLGKRYALSRPTVWGTRQGKKCQRCPSLWWAGRELLCRRQVEGDRQRSASAFQTPSNPLHGYVEPEKGFITSMYYRVLKFSAKIIRKSILGLPKQVYSLEQALSLL